MKFSHKVSNQLSMNHLFFKGVASIFVRRYDYNITKWEGSQDPPKVLFNLLVTPILRLQNNIISNIFQAHKEQRRFSLIKLWELVVIFQQTCCNYLIQYFLKYPSKALIAHFTCFVQKVCIKSSIRDLQESIVKALGMVIRKKSSKIAIK